MRRRLVLGRASRVPSVCLLGVLLSLSLAVSIAGAQDTTTGTIAGRVIDTQHLPVPGATLTEFAASPAYDSPGEIPTTPRAAGFQTLDGFKTRSPFDAITSVHGDWNLHLRGSNRVVLSADVFNLFNQQTVLDYDPDLETSFGVNNPDLGQPSRNSLSQLQTPRQIRFGVRYEF